MKKNPSVVLINPNLVLQDNDVFTTGIVYMPAGLSYFAGTLKANEMDVSVVDAFGENPKQWFKAKNLIFRGLTPGQTADKVNDSVDVCVIYAINLTYHKSIIEIIKKIKNKRPSLPVIVMENSQAVTAYAIEKVQKDFHQAGADYFITGDSEERGVKLIKAIIDGKPKPKESSWDGIGIRVNGSFQFKRASKQIEDLDHMAMPAWELFPLKNYWGLRYSHGPLSSKKYLPIITSRGCPYPCGFCVIPETNSRRWRGRGAKSVADEMEFLKKTFGVSEFHLEDVNPTVNEERTKNICQEIINRKLDVQWKICSGTKVETIKNGETIKLMAQAGCRYISISPESGSERVMKLINKPFNLKHAINLVHDMNKNGIRSQACFVLGYPGETSEDREKSLSMVKELSEKGIDEIAVFVVTPVPGSSIYEKFKGYDSYSELTFSPTWREDYKELNRFRLKMYKTFLWTKFRKYPVKFMKQPINFLTRRFQTKMEMVPYRALHTKLMKWRVLGNNVSYNI